MKLFKKLMAVALAGAMALTVLTGCGSVVNERELVATLNDMKALEKVYDVEEYEHGNVETGVKTITCGSSALANQVLNKVKTYLETHPDDYLNAGALLNHAYDPRLDEAKIRSIVPKDSKDAYYFTYMRVKEYQSEEYKNNKAGYMAQELKSSWACALNHIADRTGTLGDKAVASVASGEIAGNTYLVVVFVQAAK